MLSCNASVFDLDGRKLLNYGLIYGLIYTVAAIFDFITEEDWGEKK